RKFGKSEAESTGRQAGNGFNQAAAKTARPLKLPPFSASQLKGDLDNIVLKSFRKEPDNRYQSVELFAQDIEKYLSGQPVSARPATLRYRTTKFIKRNKIAVASAALVFLSLIAGIGIATWQAYLARVEREISERRFEDVRQLANKIVFKYHDAIAALPGSTETREMLVKDAIDYLDRLSQNAQDRPELMDELALSYIRIGNVQGETYRANLGDTQGATESYKKAVDILEKLTNKYPDNIQYKRDLREAYRSITSSLVRQDQWAEAKSFAEKHYETSRLIINSGSANLQDEISFVRSYQILGDSAEFDGGHEEAIKLFRQCLIEAEKLYRQNPQDENLRRVYTSTAQRLGTRLEYQADYLREKSEADNSSVDEEIKNLYLEAERLHKLSVDLSYDLKRDFPNNQVYERYIAATEINLGTALARNGKGNEGIPLIQKSLDYMVNASRQDPKNAEAKRDIAECYQYLAFARASMNNFLLAIDANKKSLEILEKITEEDPTNFEFLKQAHLTYNNLGDLLLKQNKINDALIYYRKGKNFAEKMSEINRSQQIRVLLALSQEKIGKALIAQYLRQKKAETLTEAKSMLQSAYELFSELHQNNQLGKIYHYKIRKLEADLKMADGIS
ncbi:MAG TPA: hypothetical protein VNK26_01570, partial [Pyrinomonadaceae bacterium]|nr:hypothetical protein [Pyrinomonadaceae bacterium]